jgi:hypothetical protein
MERASHALATDTGTWLVDPVDNPRVDELENVAGVIQLLDRHNRDCAAIASQLGVPLLRVPERLESPFEIVRILDLPFWRERALWWPDRRVLVAAEVLGTLGFFTFGRARLGVHPLLRLRRPRLVERFDPDVVLVGHGEGVTLRETGG